MANTCFFNLRVVSKEKDKVERFWNILRYCDKDYCLYRVYHDSLQIVLPAELDPITGRYYRGEYSGTVAWTAYNWIDEEYYKMTKGKDDTIYPYMLDDKGELIQEVKKDEFGHEYNGYKNLPDKTCHYSILQEICLALAVGVEIFTNEPGMGFSEHYIINQWGKITTNKFIKNHGDFLDFNFPFDCKKIFEYAKRGRKSK